VGWGLRGSSGAEFVSAALRMALIHRQPPEGLLHHSDRGVQYASIAYRKLLATHGLTPSMSPSGLLLR
jgi:putative transposase